MGFACLSASRYMHIFKHSAVRAVARSRVEARFARTSNKSKICSFGEALMSSAGNSLPTRRNVVVGGLTMGALGVTAAIMGRDFAKAAVEGTRLPPAPRDGTVDVLHGIRIEDPFRPLEDAERVDV